MSVNALQILNRKLVLTGLEVATDVLADTMLEGLETEVRGTQKRSCSIRQRTSQSAT